MEGLIAALIVVLVFFLVCRSAYRSFNRRDSGCGCSGRCPSLKNHRSDRYTAGRSHVISTLLVCGAFSPAFATDLPDTDSTDNPTIPGTGWSLAMTGFGDFVSTLSERNDVDPFGLGQAELEVGVAPGDRIEIALALSYLGSGVDAFGIGSFTFDFTLFDRKPGDSGSTAGIRSIRFLAGQFDVPFGLDWQVYPSIDRKLVSSPLVVEHTHAFWNDYGMQSYLEATWGNGVFFVTNGFGCEGTTMDGEELLTESDYGAGGRLGLGRSDLIEVGGSFARIPGRNSTPDMQLVGADLHFVIRDFAFKAEYIAHSFDLAKSRDFTNSGYYLQALYSFERCFVVCRMDSYREGSGIDGELTGLSGGAGLLLNDMVELRFEYQNTNAGRSNSTYFQVVMGF